MGWCDVGCGTVAVSDAYWYNTVLVAAAAFLILNNTSVEF